MSNHITAIIPARGGSKGVPKKNIRLLGEYPLIAYTVAACLKSPCIQRVIVSTDSQEIVDVAKKFGAEAPFLRPAEISGDFSTDYEAMDHALTWFEKNEGSVPDFIVHMRPTTPLRDPSLIEEAVRQMICNDQATALRSVHEMSESAYKCFEIDGARLKTVGAVSFELDTANNARQKFPKTYSGNGYVDVLRTSFIKKEKRIHGDNVLAYVTPYVTEVDTLDDFAELEFQMSRQPILLKKLFS